MEGPLFYDGFRKKGIEVATLNALTPTLQHSTRAWARVELLTQNRLMLRKLRNFVSRRFRPEIKRLAPDYRRVSASDSARSRMRLLTTVAHIARHQNLVRAASTSVANDGRAMLDSYGRVGNMAPPFGALAFAPTENEARVTPTGRRGVPMRLPSSPRFELSSIAFRGARVCAGGGGGWGGLRGQTCRPPLRPRHHADGGSSDRIATITSPALECPSRICLLPGAEKDPKGTGSLCTAGCESNSDCEDGELGDKTDPQRPPLQERLRLHVADDGRQLLLPAVLRLPRLHEPTWAASQPPEVCKSPSSGGPNPPTCVNVH